MEGIHSSRAMAHLDNMATTSSQTMANLEVDMEVVADMVSSTEVPVLHFRTLIACAHSAGLVPAHAVTPS